MSKVLTLFTLLIVAIVALIASVVLASGEPKLSPVINTAYGQVQGLDSDVVEGVYSFKGIPFAAPPVGQLRFAPPQDPAAWSGVRKATEWSAGCMQACTTATTNCEGFPIPQIMLPKTISEDCLYLNVYTPTLNATANLPVVVFFYGGDFVSGSGGVPLYEGSDFASNQNVVFVTINYRLGAFGGLFVNNGNFHIKDQRKSLEWVQKSIRNFGGNPDNVLISGQSAGSASTTFHLISPKSWGLFHKAIGMSNPLGIPALDPALAIELSDLVSKNVGCPTGGGIDQLACLRAVPADVMLQKGSGTNFPFSGKSAFVMMMRWTAVVNAADPDGVPEQPVIAFANNRVAPKVPFMPTTVANESVQFVYGAVDKPVPCSESELIAALFFNNFTIAQRAVEVYGPLPNLPDCRMPILCPLVTDLLFYCPWRWAGRKLAKNNAGVTNYYEYYFSLSYASWLNWTYTQHNQGYCGLGVTCHADDIPLIFSLHYEYYKKNGWPTPPHPPTPEEELLSLQMQSAWGNFMRTGNPNDNTGNPHLLRELYINGKKRDASRTPIPVSRRSASFPELPAYNDLSPTMNFSIPAKLIYGSTFRDNFCDFWDSQTNGQGYPYSVY